MRYQRDKRRCKVVWWLDEPNNTVTSHDTREFSYHRDTHAHKHTPSFASSWVVYLNRLIA